MIFTREGRFIEFDNDSRLVYIDRIDPKIEVYRRVGRITLNENGSYGVGMMQGIEEALILGDKLEQIADSEFDLIADVPEGSTIIEEALRNGERLARLVGAQAFSITNPFDEMQNYTLAQRTDNKMTLITKVRLYKIKSDEELQ